jgi:chaperonin cofactor prefoldin
LDWPQVGQARPVDEFGRAVVLVIAIDEVLDELRDRDDATLDAQIATLEDMRAGIVTRLEAMPVTFG